MTKASYAVDTLISFKGTFRDANGALIDPTTVTFELFLPDRTKASIATVKSSIGVYTADYTPLIAGEYSYKMKGTGACIVSYYGAFNATALFD